MRKKDFNIDEVKFKYVVKRESITRIAKQLNTSRLTLRKWMVENDFKIESSRKHTNEIITLSKEQEDALFGGLLGDACLTNNGKEKNNAQISYTSSCKDHVEFFKEFFEPNVSDYGVKESKYLDKRTNKVYTRYCYRSELNSRFSEYREKWYIDNIKTIPKDLKLTSKMCLIWYLGDGSLQQCYNEKRTDLIKLSTNSFVQEEVDNILVPQLKKFGAYSALNEKGQCIIRIPRKGINKFLSYIGECPVDSYKYKWEVFDYKYKKYKENEII